jgi:hypothetical protein
MEKEKLSAGEPSDEAREPNTQKELVIHNVGETFINWAEKSWALETLITAGLKSIENGGGESCPYEYLRDIFVSKINELSKNRQLNHNEKEHGFVSDAVPLRKKAEHFINAFGEHSLTVIKKCRKNEFEFFGDNAELFNEVEKLLNK